MHADSTRGTLLDKHMEAIGVQGQLLPGQRYFYALQITKRSTAPITLPIAVRNIKGEVAQQNLIVMEGLEK